MYFRKRKKDGKTEEVKLEAWKRKANAGCGKKKHAEPEKVVAAGGVLKHLRGGKSFWGLYPWGRWVENTA